MRRIADPRGRLALALALACTWALGAEAAPPRAIQHIGYQVAATYPHDTRAFTEGLFFDQGTLWESTGFEGQSEIRQVRIADGKPIQSVKVPPGVFGEGIVRWRNQLLSVTWKAGIGYRWTFPALKRIGTVRYTGEGWGMTSDGSSIVLSDGTPVLRFLDPVSFKVRRRLAVTLNGQPLKNVNELEWIDGAIYANVWLTPWIVRIDPRTGAVDGVIDVTALMQQARGELTEKTPNGIAWDPAARRMYVVGKYWPTLFAIRLSLPAQGGPGRRLR